MQSKNAAPRWGELWYCDLGSEDACTGVHNILWSTAGACYIK